MSYGWIMLIHNYISMPIKNENKIELFDINLPQNIQNTLFTIFYT